MCLSIFLSESPNKLSNYVLLVIILYNMIINSENNLFEKKKFFKLASHDSPEQNWPPTADYHLYLVSCFRGVVVMASLVINRSAVRILSEPFFYFFFYSFKKQKLFGDSCPFYINLP